MHLFEEFLLLGCNAVYSVEFRQTKLSYIQGEELFITIAVKTSNPAFVHLLVGDNEAIVHMVICMNWIIGAVHQVLILNS